jgi:hypothetical protein
MFYAVVKDCKVASNMDAKTTSSEMAAFMDNIPNAVFFCSNKSILRRR